MPGAHRNEDSRFCGAVTYCSRNVKVNGRSWAVEGDPNSHGGGNLIQVYGPGNVRIGGKKVICAVGDAAGRDGLDHPIPPTDPSGASTNVWVYEGRDGSRR